MDARVGLKACSREVLDILRQEAKSGNRKIYVEITTTHLVSKV